MTVMIETQFLRRGHTFMPPPEVLAEIPALYATDRVEPDDKIIHVHYFSAGSDHWVAELNPETGEAFGYTRLASYPEGAEWGYSDLGELEGGNAWCGPVISERGW